MATYTQRDGPAHTIASSSTATSFPSPQSGGHAVALGVTLGVVGLLMVGLITYFIVRMRRGKPEQGEQGSEEKNLNGVGRKSTLLDTRHPASRVTPFSNNTPGANMRIARRRQDGAWVFEEPQSPFTPEGVSDPSPSPIPSATTSPRWPGQSKLAEAQSERDQRRDTSGSSVSAMGPPPPAYHPSDYTDGGHTKDP